MSFTPDDISKIVEVLDELNAKSSRSGKTLSDVAAKLTSPEDEELKNRLEHLDFNPDDYDKSLFDPYLVWNQDGMLKIWLKPGITCAERPRRDEPKAERAVTTRKRKARSSGKKKVDAKATGPEVAGKAGSAVTKRKRKAISPAKKEVDAKAEESEVTLAEMIAKIKTDFGLEDKLTVMDTLEQAELQLQIDSSGKRVKQRASHILAML